MVNGGWVCLLAPLVGFLVIMLAGERITRRRAGVISTASVFVGFAGALVAFIDALGREPDDRSVTTTAWTWLAAGDFKVSIDLLVDPLSIVMMLVVTGVGGLIVLYSNGYMDGRGRGAAVLRVHVALRLLDADARDGRQPAAAARRLGPRRARLLPPDRLLPRPLERDRRRQEGVRGQHDRRRRDGARPLPRDREGRKPRLRHRLRRRPERAALGHRRDADRARPARGRGREVGADPAPHLAPRRDGGTDAGLRADPRGDDGDGGRLPDLPHASDLRGGARHPAPRRDPRADHPPRRRRDRARAVGHQARDRVLDDEPDRLHVRRRGHRGVPVCDVPPRHARVLQGAPLPHRRARDPPPGRRAGHPQDGRPREVDAVHALRRS